MAIGSPLLTIGVSGCSPEGGGGVGGGWGPARPVQPPRMILRLRFFCDKVAGFIQNNKA